MKKGQCESFDRAREYVRCITFRVHCDSQNLRGREDEREKKLACSRSRAWAFLVAVGNAQREFTMVCLAAGTMYGGGAGAGRGRSCLRRKSSFGFSRRPEWCTLCFPTVCDMVNGILVSKRSARRGELAGEGIMLRIRCRPG